MIIKTKIFELCDGKYNNLSELAQAMGISVSQIYRVREGKRPINQKFITGAIKAFPGHKFDDLFNFTSEPSATRSTDEPAAKKKQKRNSTQPTAEESNKVPN